MGHTHSCMQNKLRLFNQNSGTNLYFFVRYMEYVSNLTLLLTGFTYNIIHMNGESYIPPFTPYPPPHHMHMVSQQKPISSCSTLPFPLNIPWRMASPGILHCHFVIRQLGKFCYTSSVKMCRFICSTTKCNVLWNILQDHSLGRGGGEERSVRRVIQLVRLQQFRILS